MASAVRVLVLLAVVSCVLGQGGLNDASTVSPEDIFALSEGDFQLWISGRQPKAWGSSSDSNSLDTSTSVPSVTSASVLRTTSTTPRTITTTTTTTTPFPLDLFTERPTNEDPSASGGKAWFEEQEEDTTARPDVLGDQFRPAGEDFAQWLERQMNKVQEVTFVPQTALTGDQFGGSGLVTRLTTTRNRIPDTTFAPSTAGVAPVGTVPPPTSSAPAPPLAPLTPLNPLTPLVPNTPLLAQPADERPVDLQKWLRDQLQISQSLTDRLLAQWSPSGSFVRSDGHSYTPSAVSYQTSALIHGLQGVSHSSQVRNPDLHQGAVAFHSSVPSYLNQHQQQHHLSFAPQGGTVKQPTAGHPSQFVPVRREQPTPGGVFYSGTGSFYYSHPSVPHYGPFTGNYRAPLVINYH